LKRETAKRKVLKGGTGIPRNKKKTRNEVETGEGSIFEVLARKFNHSCVR